MSIQEQFPIENWQYDVANGDTKLGYEEWVAHQVESGVQTCDEWDETCAKAVSDAEQSVNARLIAAAPELLAACELLVKWSEQPTNAHPLNAAKAAILKATGQA